MKCWVAAVRMLTIMPSKAGKGHAAEHIRQSLGFSSQQCMWAGDTRGDTSMLATSMHGLLVGIATSELKEDAEGFISSGHVYPAVAMHADGVLEGMRWYGLG